MAQLASSLGSTRRDGRYTDDPAEMRRRNHVVPPPMRAGLPTRASGPGELHLALGNDGRAACVSARSWSGAYFLARLDDTGAWSTARFTERPRQCPSRPVGDRW